MNYEDLRKQYPEYISKIQLYKICRISPRSATYLLEHGIIPSIDTGKTTWRYKILLEDVIIYLQAREKVGSMIPTGAVTYQKNHTKIQQKEYENYIKPGEEAKLAEYFAYIYADYPDVLTTDDISKMLGLSNSTVVKLLRKSDITRIVGNSKTYYPKKSILGLLCTSHFAQIKISAEGFNRVLIGYQLWIKANERDFMEGKNNAGNSSDQ